MQKKQKVLLTLASLQLFALIACSGGGGNGTPTDTTPTDTTAPRVSQLTLGILTETTAEITFDLADDASEPVTVYWVAVAAAEERPSIQQVRDGQNVNGDNALLAGNAQHAPATGISITIGSATEGEPQLDGATAYKIYIVAVDEDNKNSGTPLTTDEQVPALPVIPSTATANIAENSPEDTEVIDLRNEVTGANSATYAITSASPPAQFVINVRTDGLMSKGVVFTTATPLDYEALSALPTPYTYPLTISVTGATNDRGSVTGNIVLTIGVLDQAADREGNGLIEVGSRAQLNAIRYDLNGDGVVDDAAHQTAYEAGN